MSLTGQLGDIERNQHQEEADHTYVKDGDGTTPGVMNPPKPVQAEDIGGDGHGSDCDPEDRAHTGCDSQQGRDEGQHDVGEDAADPGYQH